MTIAPSAESSITVTLSSFSSEIFFDLLPVGISSPRASSADRFVAEPLARVPDVPLVFNGVPFVSVIGGVGGVGFLLRGIGDAGVSPLLVFEISRPLMGFSSAIVLSLCQLGYTISGLYTYDS